MAVVETHVNPAGIEQLLKGGVAKHVGERAARVQAAMAAAAPRDTGQLAESLGHDVTVEGSGTGAKVVARIGVVAEKNGRAGGGITNQDLAVLKEFGDGRGPATHFASQSVAAAHG